VERRLAAILAADAVNYSRLVEADETGTLSAFKAVRRQTVEPSIAEHKGRIVKLMGDGILVEFPSVVEAVACAVEIQRTMAAHADDAEGTGRIQFRIGINLGDVIFEDDDIFGDGVNVAARLEALADPGGICVSGIVVDVAAPKLDVSFEDMGTREVKNIKKPIQTFRVVFEEEKHDRPGSAVAPKKAQDQYAIAVLPFTNMSNDPEQEYFSDGVTEDIITALAHTRLFPVIARNSTFVYKGRSVKIHEVARELGARYVLEGSVRKGGNRIRITAQLIDAPTGHHVWADRYDRQLDDIFEVQDEITGRITAALIPELTRTQAAMLRDHRPESLTAWDLFLRGMAELYQESREAMSSAREAFGHAIELDPRYGEAWSGYAHSFLREIDHVTREEAEDLKARGFEAAVKGVALAPDSAYAHFVLGTAHVWREDFDKGIGEVRRALELNPYFAEAHMALGNRLDLIGQTEEAVEKLEAGLRINPRDPNRGHRFAHLSRAYVSLGEYQLATDRIEEAISAMPNNPDLRYRLAVCLAHLDRVEEARAALQDCEALEPGFLKRRASWRPYATDERNARFFAGLVRHGLLPSED
jgi:adenylate cyclase